MTLLIESLAACALFMLFVFLMSRNPIKSIFNYPPAIIQPITTAWCLKALGVFCCAWGNKIGRWALRKK